MDEATSRQDPETGKGQRRLEEDGQDICGAPTASERLRGDDDDDDDDDVVDDDDDDVTTFERLNPESTFQRD